MCGKPGCLRGLGPGTKITITGTVAGYPDRNDEIELLLDNGTPEGLLYFLPWETVKSIYLGHANER